MVRENTIAYWRGHVYERANASEAVARVSPDDFAADIRYASFACRPGMSASNDERRR